MRRFLRTPPVVALAACSLLGVALASNDAHAQRVVVVTARPTAHARATVYAQPSVVLYDPPHVRLAIGATAGGFAGTARDSGFLGGLWGQAGVQINHLLAVFYQGHLMLGGYAAPGGGLYMGGFGFNEVMVDFTIRDILQLGIGPSIDILSQCDRVKCADLAYFGFDARIALALGTREEWRRKGFDLHPTFYGTDSAGATVASTAVLLTLGLGFY
jgi:hypothetical protein